MLQKHEPLLQPELVSVLDSAVPTGSVSIVEKQSVTELVPESTQNDTQALLNLFSGMAEALV
ncbi:hypothetical protein, partial [Pectobacterium quasiaquaticum]|uniref:hypothetical protein n=1 Tax=Pectobacterium quasiaquaticum TaxID=2774015 RepID=UPI001CF7742D